LLLRRDASWSGTLAVDESGRNGVPITIAMYGSGSRPLIRRLGATCVGLNGSFLVARGLKIRACRVGINVSGSNNTVTYMRVRRNAMGIHVSGSQNRIVRNVLNDNNRMVVNTQGGTDDYGAQAIVLAGDGTEVARNVISGSDAFSYDFGRDGAAVEVFGGRNSVVHHNLATNNNTFTELGASTSRDNVYYTNVVRASIRSAAFLVTRGATSFGPVYRTYAYNNSVYFTGGGSRGFSCGACGPDILKLRNNAIRVAGYAGYADAPFDEDYNIYYAPSYPFTRGPHSIIANPRFVSMTNLRLRSTSRAVDRGTEVGLTRDYVGKTIPRDGDGDGKAAPDIGAFER
jgi:hypothetical protein